MDWPSIKKDPEQVSRTTISDVEFSELAVKLARRIPQRECSESDYEHACGYPWERPEHSEDGSVELLDVAAQPHAGREHRYPLITFGSNGAPGVLAEKLSVLPEDTRDVLALTGTLHGYAVAPSAHLAIYGSLPATIVPVQGASVRAGLLMVTTAQFEVLTRTEFNYVLARLDGSSFKLDLDVPAAESIFVYASRRGVFAPQGINVAVESSQRQLLDRAAEIVLSAGASGRELVRRAFADYAWATEVAQPLLALHTVPFNPDEWDVFSTARAERTG